MGFADKVKAIIQVGTTDVANGNPVPVSDAGGTLTVDGTVAVTNGGTFAVQAASTLAAETTKVIGVTRTADGSGNLLTSTSNALDVNIKSGAGSGGTASADDADFTQNSTQGTPAMGVYEASPTSVTAGDMGIVGITATRAQRVSIDSNGLPALDSSTDSVTAILQAETTKVLGVTRTADGSGNLITSTSNAIDVNIKSGSSAGTQYTEDAAAAADPVGNALILVRADTPGAVTTTDGDNVAARGTNKGEQYVKHVDAIAITNADITSIKTAVETIDNMISGAGANITQLGGVNVTMGAGVVGTGVQRVVLASDDAAVTSLGLIDNSVDGNYLNVNANIAGTDMVGGAGAVAAGVLRTTLASDDPAVVSLAALDNSVDGNYLNVNMNLAGVDAAVGNGTAATAMRVTLASDTTGTVVATQSTATNLKVQAEAYMGGVAVASGAPLQVTIANTGANSTAVKVNVASGGIASGGIASGAVAASAIAAGALVAGAALDGWDATQGLKTDAKSTATDGTSTSVVSILKQISASVQAPPSQAVTGTFYQTTQPVSLASAQVASGAFASGSIASGAIASGAVASGAIASGAAVAGSFVDGAIATLGLKTDAKSTATDGTSTSQISILKQISASVQAPPSQAVTNAGTFAVQAVGSIADDATTPGAPVMIGGSAVETDGTDPTFVSAEADVAICRLTRDRRLLVSTVNPRMGSAFHDETSAQTNHELVAAPGAGLSIYITDIMVSNGATAGTIKFVEDTGGTPVQKTGTMNFAALGGTSPNFQTPIRVTANKNFGFTSATMTNHSVMVNYYIAP